MQNKANFTKCPNALNFSENKGLWKNNESDESQKQSQYSQEHRIQESEYRRKNILAPGTAWGL